MSRNFDNDNELLFDAIRIGLAAPEKIRSWSRGEVKNSETVNYRSLRPEVDGLFCEKIFGPTKDGECACGKYKKMGNINTNGKVCEKCGVEVTSSSVRRERMGHIELAYPVAHIWYAKGSLRVMSSLLEIPQNDLNSILGYDGYVVLEVKNKAAGVEVGEALMSTQYTALVETAGKDSVTVGMGAESIKKLLVNIDEHLDEKIEETRQRLEKASSQAQNAIQKKLNILLDLKTSGNKAQWMILDVIPVIPPDLRPLVQLDGGRFAASDLNDLYRRVINRNNLLLEMKGKNVPEKVLNCQKRLLQEAVDALFDNSRTNTPAKGPGQRELKSLSDALKGKQGRFRQNLLGKRVDYAGRSVIVVGPELKIYQCGLPKEMALELFKPFVIRELLTRQAKDKEEKMAINVKVARKMIERQDNAVWDVLEDVIHEHPVMLNRAPTLHRLSIQAFEPILVEGKAIKLHPLVCTAFNADFDGDQMAVHLPLSEEAQAECRFLLLSPNNLLKPSDGGPVAVPSQDMVLGIYYLTQERPGVKGEGSCFTGMNEALLAYENGYLDLHARIRVRVKKMTEEGELTGTVGTTLGRLIFNEIIPQDLGFVDREKNENKLLPEIDFLVDKGKLKKILEEIINAHGMTTTAEVLDAVKALGYKYSTKAAMTVSISDMIIPKEKDELIAKAQAKVDKINALYEAGRSSDEERYSEVIKTWKDADDELSNYVYPALGEYNNIYMMAVSGARGSKSQIKQLVGWRGLMASTTGRTLELPIIANFREGLTVLQYFMSAHGSRKGMSDTALRTADSGYLTRRLVDASQEIIVHETDCAAATPDDIPYMEVSAFVSDGELVESLNERLVGRFIAEDFVDPATKEILIQKNNMISPKTAKRICAVLDKKFGDDVSAKKVKIRTNLSCRSEKGVCAKCYGANMATGNPVKVGEAVGIIAAQSIGEPGTQLTMRTFHTGGVAGGDITQGLPRVEELLEARNPKGVATIAEKEGVVEIVKEKKNSDEEERLKAVKVGQKVYEIHYGQSLVKKNGVELKNGDYLEKGEKITEGSINPADLLKVKGLRAVQDYILHEVQRPYRSQGVEINDKHIEIIVRQILKKVSIVKSNDSQYKAGTEVLLVQYEREKKELEAAGKKPAEVKYLLKGIARAALNSDSFLSAASFQETTRVLTEASIKGSVDHLVGIKENVIIGNLIPAGTGMSRYYNVELSTDAEFRKQQALKNLEEENHQKEIAKSKRGSDKHTASEPTWKNIFKNYEHPNLDLFPDVLEDEENPGYPDEDGYDE